MGGWVGMVIRYLWLKSTFSTRLILRCFNTAQFCWSFGFSWYMSKGVLQDPCEVFFQANNYSTIKVPKCMDWKLYKIKWWMFDVVNKYILKLDCNYGRPIHWVYHWYEGCWKCEKHKTLRDKCFICNFLAWNMFSFLSTYDIDMSAWCAI